MSRFHHSLSHGLHLVRRFFGSLRPDPPSPGDRHWALDHLNDGESAIWLAMSHPDQRHSVEVARAVEAEVAANDVDRGSGEWPTAEVTGFESAEERRHVMVAAALLHDSGKTASDLGTMSRVVATVMRPTVAPEVRARWAELHGPRGRLARYWAHAQLGGAALERAGSHPLVSDWAAEHHRPAERWTVPRPLAEVLHRCDND